MWNQMVSCYTLRIPRLRIPWYTEKEKWTMRPLPMIFAPVAALIAVLAFVFTVQAVSLGSEECPPMNSPACEPPIAHWKLDEQIGPGAGIVRDHSGNRYDGTSHGSVVASGGGAGLAERALTFDGETGYVSIPHQDRFSPVLNSMTIAFWARVPVTATAAGNDDCGSTGSYFITKASRDHYEWGIENDNNRQVCFHLWQANGDGHSAIRVMRTVNDGQWHHYAVTIEYLTSFRAYIDGQPVGAKTLFEGTMDSSTAAINISRRGDESNYFVGAIGDVRIYDYTLAPQQVEALYEEHVSSIATDSNPTR
jgi:hypothetical protein